MEKGRATALQMLAMHQALKSAFAGSYFNICGLTTACRLLGLQPASTDASDWELLNAVHCVAWKEFGPAETAELVTRIARVLNVEPMDVRKLLPSVSLTQGAEQ